MFRRLQNCTHPCMVLVMFGAVPSNIGGCDQSTSTTSESLQIAPVDEAPPAAWRPLNQGLKLAVRRVVVDPQRPTTLYAIAEGRRYRSDDRGRAWQPLDPASTDAEYEDLAIDPRSEGALYAGSYYGGGLSKSLDGGASWESLTELRWLTEEWNGAAITVSPSDPQVIYVRSRSGLIGRSVDAGQTWALLPGAPSATALAVASSDAEQIYVLAQEGGVHRTTDGGSTFDEVSGSLPSSDAPQRSVLAIDPNDSDTLIVGVAGAGVFQSTSAGASWRALPDAVSDGYTFAAIDPQASDRLYVGTDSQVLASTDGGAQWAPIFDRRAFALAFAPDEERSVYLGADDGVYRSDTDAFVPSSAGLMSEFVESLSVDAHNPEIAYAVAHRGLYVTTERGRGWTLAWEWPHPASRSPVIVDRNRTGVAYSEVGDGLVRTEDGGRTWTDARGDLATRPKMPGVPSLVTPLAVAPGNSDVIYAVVPGERYGALVKTIDGGASWRELPAMDYCCVSMIAVSADHAYILGWEGFLSETQDGGETWTSLWTRAGFVDSVAIDPSDARVLYAVGPENYPDWQRRVVRKSPDGGAAWTTMASVSLPALIEQLVVAPQGHLYARASASSEEPRTLFVSTDGGETFTEANDGLDGNDVSEIAAGGDCVGYAGTRGGGIFTTTTGGGACP
jgi:photosystem II stability/assembly factor-like uncharacterized protein